MQARLRQLVLVVDDELSARLLMRAALEEGGFDVAEAGTVQQAFMLFEACRPDLVMLDVMLPDGDGVELCARLRALPAGRDVPVAMVTGVNDESSIQRAFQCGATDFITKPISWGTMAHRTRFLLRAHQQEQRIARLAFHDELTGLPNRRLCLDRLSLALLQARREGQALAVLFVDVDRFKNINDSLGHASGDELLKQVARRLLDTVRAGDTVARMGGDEFVLLCPGADSRAIATRAQRMLDQLEQPYHVTGMALHLSSSMGIACYPQDGDTADVLVRNADAAMHLAKERGRNNFQFYAPALNAGILARLKLEMDLRAALDAGEFELHYQPKVRLDNGALYGVEALIRWRKDGAMVPPGQFIPVAEESGLIGAIGDWVAAEACRQHRAWTQVGLPALRVAVNVSARQFARPGFTAALGELVRVHGCTPDAIELELTESMLMTDVQRATQVLGELKAQGFSVAVDDFGTGFSSLNYLRHFPVDVLKIDQSFVRELLDGRAALAIIEAIIALAGALGMQSVAEGVETDAQRILLRERGCNAMQGYLLARPMPAGELANWVAAYLGQAPGA